MIPASGRSVTSLRISKRRGSTSPTRFRSLQQNNREEIMPGTSWGRRDLLKVISAGAATGVLGGAARNASAQVVKWSTGTEPPKLMAPANSCDCHHHIYDAKYPVDPRATLRPDDAFVGDYRMFQKRIGTTRNVVVTPSTYGTDNRVTLDAIDAFGPTARAVVVVDDAVTDYRWPAKAHAR